MKKKSLKIISVLLAVIFFSTFFAASVPAAETVFRVSTAAEMTDAINTVAATGAGDYVISLQSDISGVSVAISGAGTNVTIAGNGHTLTFNGDRRFDVSNGATLNLGDGTTTLNIVAGANSDAPGSVHISGSDSVCNMYEGVTISGHTGQNYYGGGVTVEGGTFIMEGGTITDCGIEGGLV